MGENSFRFSTGFCVVHKSESGVVRFSFASAVFSHLCQWGCATHACADQLASTTLSILFLTTSTNQRISQSLSLCFETKSLYTLCHIPWGAFAPTATELLLRMRTSTLSNPNLGGPEVIHADPLQPSQFHRDCPSWGKDRESKHRVPHK